MFQKQAQDALDRLDALWNDLPVIPDHHIVGGWTDISPSDPIDWIASQLTGPNGSDRIAE